MTHKESFIEFMFNSGVLIFGEFTLKSGRNAPYFINTGNYYTGKQIARLGEYYAECFMQNNIEANTLFGPAYKGIPLAAACSIALSQKYDKNLYYSFDRKEIKDHGEGGFIVGKVLENNDKIAIIEDVITAGTAVRSTVSLLKNYGGVDITSLLVSVDRMEKGKGELSAVQEVQEEFGINVYSIVTIEDIIKAIRDEIIPGKAVGYLEKMSDYRDKYGI